MNADQTQPCDVLIVGGGPAGSACAWSLKNQGLNVIVLDKASFPRDKVCAGWVTPQIFQSLQIDPLEYGRGNTLQPISAFRTGVIGRPLLLTRYGRTVSYAIRRCEFDHYLLQRSRARHVGGEPIRSIARTQTGWLVNGRLEARMLVGAGGHFCPVSQWLNQSAPRELPVVLAQEAEFELDDSRLRHCAVEPETPEIYFCPDLRGYGWCVRKGKYLNIGLGRDEKARLSDHVAQFVQFLKEQRRIDFDIPAPFRGHAYRLKNHSRPRVVDDRIVLIGDAAGLADAHSGEGIRPAVESGLLAARTISQARPDFPSSLLYPYLDSLKQRYAVRTLAASTPGPLRRWAGRQLLKNRWFTSHVLIKKWFLHSDLLALTFDQESKLQS